MENREDRRKDISPTIRCLAWLKKKGEVPNPNHSAQSPPGSEMVGKKIRHGASHRPRGQAKKGEGRERKKRCSCESTFLFRGGGEKKGEKVERGEKREPCDMMPCDPRRKRSHPVHTIFDFSFQGKEIRFGNVPLTGPLDPRRRVRIEE